MWSTCSLQVRRRRRAWVHTQTIAWAFALLLGGMPAPATARPEAATDDSPNRTAVAVSLDFEACGPVPVTVLGVAAREAQTIWAPAGVSIDPVVHACRSGEPSDHTVPLAPRSSRQMPRRPLAGVFFDERGVPAPIIDIYTDALREMTTKTLWLDLGSSQWSSTLRSVLEGRMLGRVLAHEIGHYLLRVPRHETSGLMRADHLTTEFVDNTRSSFTLTRWDRDRIHAVAVGRRPASTPDVATVESVAVRWNRGTTVEPCSRHVP